MNPLQSIIVALCIALALSTGVNAWLGSLWLDARDDVATKESQRENAAGAAKACNTSIEALRKMADTNRDLAAGAIAAAEAKARTFQQRADAILSTPASTPGDDCKSASDRIDRWWKAKAP